MKAIFYITNFTVQKMKRVKERERVCVCGRVRGKNFVMIYMLFTVIYYSFKWQIKKNYSENFKYHWLDWPDILLPLSIIRENNYYL